MNLSIEKTQHLNKEKNPYKTYHIISIQAESKDNSSGRRFKNDSTNKDKWVSNGINSSTTEVILWVQIMLQNDFEFCSKHLGGIWAKKSINPTKNDFEEITYSQYFFSYLSGKIVILTPNKISSKMYKNEPSLKIYLGICLHSCKFPADTCHETPSSAKRLIITKSLKNLYISA